MGSNDLPVKKIYIDSKFRRHDSVSTSNFKIELPYTLKFSDNTIFYVDDVCIPHTWNTIEAGVNDKLYLRLTTGGLNTDYILLLTPQNYNGVQLATEISARINYHTTNQVHTCTYNSQTQRISLSFASFDCKVFTDYELKALPSWNGNPVSNAYDINNLDSANELLNNTTNVSTTGTNAIPVQFYLSLQPVRNIYMRSPNISSFNTIGCNGESSIIKQNTCIQ